MRTKVINYTKDHGIFKFFMHFISQEHFTLFTTQSSQKKSNSKQQAYTILRGKFIPQNYMSKATIMYPSSKSHHNFTKES